MKNNSVIRENGCLQIIPGSHKLGRLDHNRKGDLASVDMDRLEEIVKVLGEPVMAETQPGDVLFFHSNLLHTSGPNLSPDKRWNLVLAFNQVRHCVQTSTYYLALYADNQQSLPREVPPPGVQAGDGGGRNDSDQPHHAVYDRQEVY